MQFEYDLVPASGEFAPEALTEMAGFLSGLVSRRSADDHFIVYRNDEKREFSPLPTPEEPDWVNGFVHLRPGRVTLGLLPDPGVQRQLHEFAAWVVERWPATLHSGGAKVPLAELLPEDA